MLSRIAESLYWIGRYVERADDTSRILNVSVHQLLEDATVDPDHASRQLLAVLGIAPDSADTLDVWKLTELVAYAKAKKLTFAPTLANIESRWFYYEHPDILRLPILQDALYPRGRQMLADADRKSQTLSAPDFAQRKVRMREQSYPFIKAMSDAGVRVVTGTDCGAEASQVTPFGHATQLLAQLRRWNSPK